MKRRLHRWPERLLRGTSLGRQLIHEWPLAVALVGVVLLGGLALAGTLKLWRVTPEALPVVQISGLDWLQAKRARAHARAAAESGQLDSALVYWQSALVENPGDPTPIREALAAMHAAKRPSRAQVVWANGNLGWLFALGRTNQADLELAARFFDAQGKPVSVVKLLAPLGFEMGQRVAGVFLKSSLLCGNLADFAKGWEHWGRTFDGDPALGLCHAAWQLATRNGDLNAAQQALDAAAQSADSAGLALRLKLVVAEATDDPDLFARALGELELAGGGMVGEEFRFWRLLIRTGRRAEAAARFRSRSLPIVDDLEAAQVADLLPELGLDSEFPGFVETQLKRFPHSAALQGRQVRFLLVRRQWAELRIAAGELRRTMDAKEHADTAAQVLESLAETGLGRNVSGDEAWRKAAADLRQLGPPLSLEIAREFDRLGRGDRAFALLEAVLNEAGELPGFWVELHRIAMKQGNYPVATLAAERAYHEQPDDMERANDLAATLLLQRLSPERAIVLTTQVLAAQPDSLRAHLNHCEALLQNGRADEAEQLLAELPLETLPDQARAMAQLAWFDCHRQLHRPAAAKRALDQVQTNHLFAPQVRWLEQARAGLRATPSGS